MTDIAEHRCTADIIAARIANLERALEEIAYPISAMQARAEAEGSLLNGVMAIRLANDPEYLRRIALRALTKEPSA